MTYMCVRRCRVGKEYQVYNSRPEKNEKGTYTLAQYNIHVLYKHTYVFYGTLINCTTTNTCMFTGYIKYNVSYLNRFTTKEIA